VRIELESGVPIFRASANVQARIVMLLEKQQFEALTESEEQELDAYEEIDDYLSFVNRTIRNLAVAPNSESSGLGADLYSPVALLDDDGVIALAQIKLDAGQNERLGDLQEKGKAQGLTQAEQDELWLLMQSYRLGLLQKSEALAEAKARGLTPNLAQ
jgi:uncharacterized protein YnzC (UPF0291/DUF896 family)